MLKFDVNTALLKEDERLRIVGGDLYVEKRAVREKSHFLYRLFTRAQYSRAGCLAKIQDAALKALQENRSQDFENIQKNYTALIDRARLKNDETASWFWLTRFFYAKLPVDLLPHWQTQDLLQAAIDFQKIPANYSSLSDLAQIHEQAHLCKKKCQKAFFEVKSPFYAQKEALLGNIKALKKRVTWELEEKDLTFIDKGNFGIICQVNKWPQVAVKIPNGAENSEKEIHSEYRFLKALHRSWHLTAVEKGELYPRPVKVKYKDKTAFLVPYYPGKSLIYHRHLTLSDKVDITTSLIKQMAILSKAQVVYTDIKLGNVLVDLKNKRYPFADFGGCSFEFNSFISTSKQNALSLTPAYAMKEDIQRIHDSHFGSSFFNLQGLSALRQALDQHSSRALGLLLCELYSGREVYFTQKYTMPELEEYIRDCQPLASLETDYPELADVIKGMLGVGREQLLPKQALEEWSSIF